mmetsp:Transcript_47354/g.88732  ORF Transcript_47354/g.88732 Transcript_47354/m.88732 type:complete len:166 (+) Transcript_47354:45-542(+)
MFRICRMQRGAQHEVEMDEDHDPVEVVDVSSLGRKTLLTSMNSTFADGQFLSPKSGIIRHLNFPGSKFDVTLRKQIDYGNGLLGIVVNQETDVLTIQKVLGGPVQEWNDNNPGCRIGCGDEIVEVNGSKGSAAFLLDQMRHADVVRMVIKREKTPAQKLLDLMCA